MTTDWKRPNHLRLVTDDPPPARQPPRRLPRGLTVEERTRLAVALRNLHSLYGTWNRVADKLGISKKTVMNVSAGAKGSMTIAVRAARLAGIPVEALLSGAVVSTDRCPFCGQPRETTSNATTTTARPAPDSEGPKP